MSFGIWQRRVVLARTDISEEDIEAMFFSETSALARTTRRRHIPEDKFLMKNGVFWDVTPCGYYKNRRFGGTYRFHHQCGKNWAARNNMQRISVASYC
jgi:hypothetical protein